ncbi:hypothetical protein F1728_24295 [Gimesia benthica]|uniref:Uncharacterized protein n=1 Tax=Gimesia benthica TaxID=2608982 RepID=A0A6I6AJ81_9PLAN|nr:hypothetical protein [Gimesia benthica]QGQ25612.1 hypothetical protein F1728_24295 [Gimesia benthica]
MTTTQLPLPLYTFLLKDNSGAVFLRAGEDFLMPFFTSEENAILYKQRGQLDCNIIHITETDHVKSYIECPPSRLPVSARDFKIVIDPIGPSVGEYMVLERQQLLDSL